jgi:hypothetical protein
VAAYESKKKSENAEAAAEAEKVTAEEAGTIARPSQRHDIPSDVSWISVFPLESADGVGQCSPYERLGVV